MRRVYGMSVRAAACSLLIGCYSGAGGPGLPGLPDASVSNVLGNCQNADDCRALAGERDSGRTNQGTGKVACGGGGDCDPGNLGGASCTSLGMGNGMLLCDPVTCMYDTSMCFMPVAGTGGGAGSGS